MAELTKQQLSAENSNSFPNNNAGLITPTVLRAFNNDMIDSLVDEISYTADSASFNSRINNVTGSAGTISGSAQITALGFVSSSVTASSLVTASFDNGTRNLTFTKGDASTFNVNIPDVSGSILPSGILSSSVTNFTDYSASVDSRILAITGSSINTGSFATTGSNTFTGNQIISTAGNTQLDIQSTGGGQANIEFKAPNANFQAHGDFRINNNGQFGGSGSINLIVKDNEMVFGATNGFRLGVTNTTGNAIEGGNVQINIPSGSSQLVLTGSMNVIGALTASIQQGFVLVGGVGNISELVATSSFGSSGAAGATLGANTFTGSQTIANADGSPGFTMSGSGQNNVNFIAPNTFFSSTGNFSFNNAGNAGGTGSLTFSATSSSIQLGADNGVIIARTSAGGPAGNGFVKLNTISGSLVLAPSGFSNNAVDLLHLSSSSNTNFVNLIFKNNTTAADTIVSGSNNIFTNPAAVTTGFKRYIGGSSNYYTHGAGVPQISGSMGFSPSMNGNIISNVTANGVTMRGPVSSSAYTMNGNIIMGASAITLGSSAANHFERAVSGLNMNGNALFNGNISMVANTNSLSSSLVLSGNLVFGGTVSLNHISSSSTYNSNVTNGQFTLNNRFTPAAGTSPAATSIRANTNTLYGTGHVVNVGGTNVSLTQGKSFSFNILAGTFLTASMGDGDSSSVIATAILGSGLVVTGSTLTATFAGPDTISNTQGSAFVGRFNSVTGNAAKTAETVFAVGTGTSYTNRKTGFLVDSGSNTFVEGTLNVSGSTTMTGSVSISQTMQLGSLDPLPTGVTGMLAVSSSLLWFYDATQWRQVSLI